MFVKVGFVGLDRGEVLKEFCSEEVLVVVYENECLGNCVMMEVVVYSDNFVGVLK